MCVIIPAFAEFGLSEAHPKYALLYTMLYFCDTLFFVNFLSMYSIVRSTVFAINYLPKTNMIEVETFTKLLQKTSLELNPTQIA